MQNKRDFSFRLIALLVIIMRISTLVISSNNILFYLIISSCILIAEVFLLVICLYDKKKYRVKMIVVVIMLLLDLVPIPSYLLMFITNILSFYLVFDVTSSTDKDDEVTELETPIRTPKQFHFESLIRFISINAFITLIVIYPYMFIYMPINRYIKVENLSVYKTYIPFILILVLIIFILVEVKKQTFIKDLANKERFIILSNYGLYYVVITGFLLGASQIFTSLQECYTSLGNVLLIIVVSVIFWANFLATKKIFVSKNESSNFEKRVYYNKLFVISLFWAIFIYLLSYNLSGSGFDESYLTTLLGSIALVLFITKYIIDVKQKKNGSPNFFMFLAIGIVILTYLSIILFPFGHNYIVCT